jgi:alkanesulfonate monooxygenase SsuD/methylene tetrahydromethanopterin reductase-like flavin-dependent oxidoreductase (luciferase family)
MRDLSEGFGVGAFIPGMFGPLDRPEPDRETVQAAHAAMFREAEAAERAGFEGLFVGEQHMRTECFFPDVFLLLGALAGRTSRVRLGTFVNVLTLWDPMHVAETTALIDHLSQGRLTLGAGAGFHTGYWQMFGIDPKRPLRRFLEAMEVLQTAWTSKEPFTFRGEYFTYEDVFLTPKPYQDPHPPVWAGAQMPKAIEAGGTYATAWTVAPFPLDKEVFKREVELFKTTAIANGVADPKIVIMRNGFVAETREEAERVFGPYYADEMRFYYDHGIFTDDPRIQSREDVNVENLRDTLVIGTPDDCVEALERVRDEYEADYVVMRFRMNDGPDSGASLRAIELFGEQVLPRVQTLGQPAPAPTV